MITEFEKTYFKKNFRFNWEPKRERVKPILVKVKHSTINIDKVEEIIGEKRTRVIMKNLITFKGEKKKIKIQDKGVLYIYVI